MLKPRIRGLRLATRPQVSLSVVDFNFSPFQVMLGPHQKCLSMIFSRLF